jgi:hypothetical protein
MTETEKELNAWRELGEEMGRVISLMDAETFADWFPDWFGPRLFDLQVQGSAAAPPAPTAEPRYTESSIRQFIGWLSADIPALNSVLVPDLADSWERFKQRMLGAAPPERVSEGKESTCQSPSDGTKTTSSEPAKKDAPNAATHLSRMPGVALRAAATSGDAQPVNERGSLKSETDAARPAVEPREEPRR